jgi:hypothetical protein
MKRLQRAVRFTHFSGRACLVNNTYCGITCTPSLVSETLPAALTTAPLYQRALGNCILSLSSSRQKPPTPDQHQTDDSAGAYSLAEMRAV